jgi:hypothetical protein
MKKTGATEVAPVFLLTDEDFPRFTYLFTSSCNLLGKLQLLPSSLPCP